ESDASDEAALEHALTLIRSHNAISDTVARARHYGEIARDALAPLPQSEHKQALLDVVDFCVSRVS
ncbi:MAG: polyprenyl synthetase family protein, partial [Pseudomonadota bacterium]